jgi:hypothetical protein
MEVVAQERAGVEVGLKTETHRLEERAGLEAAVEAQLAAAERLRMEVLHQISEAENRSRAEEEQSLVGTADLERLNEEVADRRAEVEAAFHKAYQEVRLELQQATEQSRQPTSEESLWLEPEICEPTHT